MNRVKCIIENMDNVLTGNLKEYESLHRTKYQNILADFGDILSKITMTELRIGNLEKCRNLATRAVFNDLHKSINDQLTVFGDYENFNFMHIRQAQSIKELYHELWILFKEMGEVYKDPYAELDENEEDTSLLGERVYAFEKCLDLIQEVYDVCSTLEEQLKSTIKPIWEAQLTDLNKSGKQSDFHLIVSVRKNNDLQIYSDDRDIISCSYFNPKHVQLFRNDCVGFCYGLDERYLVGMSSSDCGLASVSVKEKEEYKLVFGGIRVSRDAYLEGITSDFLPYYYPEDLQKSDTYNEIVLRGDAKPIAIFTPAEIVEQEYSEIVAASALYKLPIVIYNRFENTINVLPRVCLTRNSATPELE